MRKLNTAQKIILVIGLIALAIRCFTYEPSTHWNFSVGRFGGIEKKFNYNVVFHCLGIISATAVLMLIAGFFGDRLALYLADKRKLLLWVGISISALVVIGAITWGIHYYLESRPSPSTTSSTNTTKPVIQPSEIELFDMKIRSGRELSGRVKNNSSMKISEIKLQVLVYDSAGKYVDTDTVTISYDYDEPLAPGEVRSFEKSVYFSATLPENWGWNDKIISISVLFSSGHRHSVKFEFGGT